MEQLNRIEVRGRIGNVRVAAVGEGKAVAHFSVATNLIYRNQEGATAEEVTWHNCTLWSGRKYPDLGFLQVGMGVSLVGRIRNTRYTGTDGVERYSSEIWVNDVEVLPSSEILKSESAI